MHSVLFGKIVYLRLAEDVIAALHLPHQSAEQLLDTFGVHQRLPEVRTVRKRTSTSTESGSHAESTRLETNGLTTDFNLLCRGLLSGGQRFAHRGHVRRLARARESRQTRLKFVLFLPLSSPRRKGRLGRA